jgi:hypothetical protein
MFCRNMVAPLLQEDDPTQGTIEPFFEWCCLAYTGGIGSANPLASSAPPPLHFGVQLEQNCRCSLAKDLLYRFRTARQGSFPTVDSVKAAATTTVPSVVLAPDSLAPLVQAFETYNQDHFARLDAAATRESKRRAQEEDRHMQEKIK